MAVVPKSFQVPVPASQARSRAQEILDGNRSKVEGYNAEAQRELARILVRAQQQLEARLAGALRTRGEDAWTHQDIEAQLVMVRQALAGIAPEFRGLLARNAARAGTIGAKNTAELVAHFEARAGRGLVRGGVLRPLSPGPAMQLQKTTLLERHATSVDRYGVHMIGVIRRELQAGLVRGATFEEMTRLLVGTRGPRGIVSMLARENPDGSVTRIRTERIYSGLFVKHRAWAERIVVTEGLFAMNGAAFEEIAEQKAHRFPDAKKRAIAHFDKRTAQDSYPMHGQTREVWEPFTDGMGRQGLYPPLRPRDRETVILWRDTWASDLASIGVEVGKPGLAKGLGGS